MVTPSGRNSTYEQGGVIRDRYSDRIVGEKALNQINIEFDVLALGGGFIRSFGKKLTSNAVGNAGKTGVKALKPLGLGSTGRVQAANLTEQLAMKEVMSDPTLGKVVMTGMKDSRWPGWSKMQYTHTALDGAKTTIHYVGQFNYGVLTAVDDFKFVFP